MTDSNVEQEAGTDFRQLGQYLLEKNLVTQTQLDAALAEQQVTRDRLGLILVRNGFLPRAELVNAVMHVAPANLHSEVLFSTRVPPAELVASRTMVVAETGNTAYLATLGSEKQVLADLSKYYPGMAIKFVPVALEKLEKYLRDIGGNNDSSLLETLIREALSDGVSDMHIVPRYASYTVMFRRHGVRQHHHEGSIDEYLVLVARIKDKAHMDLAERRTSQDGGFQAEHNGRLVDMRVVTLPTPDGEYVVIRLLDPDRVQPNLVKLGITNVTDWRKGIARPDGLCLICGPTGSGKTTTVNATIKELDRFGSAVFTAEDPVEYRLSYTGQVNVNNAVGLDFAKVVRAFMRADPDVIVLGEVRDAETAANAIRAADTGHLVLATLHTGSIQGAIQRITDLGVDSNDLVHILRAILVQRLVRTVCPHCHGAGCPACRNTGYAERTVVSECVYLRSEDEVQRLLDGGIWWENMLDDAVRKHLRGDVDWREMTRVFGQAEAEAALARAQQAGLPATIET